MFSRVRTQAGMFCRKSLSRDLRKYAVPEALRKMLDRFRDRCSVSYWDDSQYDELFDEN
jgi:hypothetical protein